MNRFCASLCVVIFFLTGTFQVWAQSLSFDADSLFMEARILAMNKDYTGAREKCYQLLEQHPAYHDARVLIGRTLAWEHKYDSARAELQKVIALIDYADAIDALIDVERWSGNQEKALYYCDYGLKRYPNYEDFMLKKARILMETGKSDLAQRNILHVLELNPGNVDARKLLQEVKNVNILNKISLQYSYEYFKEPWVRRWHLMNIAYSRQTRYGSVTGRVYLGDVVLDGESLFEKNTALQYELEAYPVLSKKNYAYISYGYSPDNLFPKHRFGGELYQKFFRTFELSAGIRNLQFRSSEAAKKRCYDLYWIIRKVLPELLVFFKTIFKHSNSRG